MPLRNLNLTGIDYTGYSPSEVVTLARSQIGALWSKGGAADFVWAVANLSGARYGAAGPAHEPPEAARVSDSAGRDPPTFANHTTAGVYAEGLDNVWHTWRYLRLSNVLDVARPGDIVRLWSGPEGAATSFGHSFIVTSVTVEGIRVVDNWARSGPGCFIIEHALTDILSSPAFGNRISTAYVSRMQTATRLTGTEDANLLQGDNASNVITGRGGDDSIYGRSGHDTIMGDDGADQLRGGGGNDVIFGGAGRDRILGGTGDDSIYGGAGQDVLWGNAGADSFHFAEFAPFGHRQHDFVRDFSVTDDTICLHAGTFDGIGSAGPMRAEALTFGHAAADADDRIIYDATNGALMYDPDGSGAQAVQFIALLNRGLKMTVADFMVYE